MLFRSTVASVLAKLSYISRIILCDSNSGILGLVAKRISSEKIITRTLNANDTAQMIQTFNGCDVIIDMLPPRLAPSIMTIAIAVRTNYINSAFEQPFWNELISGAALSFSAEFKNIEKTAILGCGNSPGLVNVIVRKYCDKFDSIESVRIAGTNIANDKLINSPWIQYWSPEQALRDYFTRPCVLINGSYAFNNVFSERDSVDFGQYGSHIVSLHSHEEVYSLPRILRKGIRICEFKYQFNDFLEKLSRLGFTPNKYVVINGVKINLFDALVKLIPLPVENFIQEDPNAAYCPEEYVTKISITGTHIDTQSYQRKINLILPPLWKATNALEQFGTKNIDVAVPIAVGIKLLEKGLKHGIVFPEEIDPSSFLAVLNEFVDYHEEIQTNDEG